MRSLVIPESSVPISRLSFGTASLHLVLGRAAQRRLLNAAVEMGFTHFDCAPLYGCGYNEQVVGSVLSETGRSVTVASKVGIYPARYHASQAGVVGAKLLGKFARPASVSDKDFTARRAAESLRGSLRRLRREALDILFLHEPPDDPAMCEEIVKWLLCERAAGTIRTWGIAGDFDRMGRWLNLAEDFVVQTRNSTIDAAQLQALSKGGKFVFTFSCLSNRGGALSAEERLRRAAAKNPAGSLIVASRRSENLQALVQWVGDH